MKKLFALVSSIFIMSALLFTGCKTNTPAKPSSKVTKIDGSKTNEWNFVTINLGEYYEQSINIDFSTDMLVENENETSQNLMWQVSTGGGYPVIAAKEFENGTSDWEKVSGSSEALLIESSDAYFYLNAGGLDYKDLTIYIDNFSLVITDTEGNAKTYKVSDLNANDGVLSQVDKNKLGASDWLAPKIPSIYETYKDQFDYIGIAAEYGNFGLKQTGSNKYTATYSHEGWGNPTELYYEEIQKGIAKHANSITLGNELKPQFLLQWWGGDCNNTLVDFTDSTGKTIKVPNALNGEKLIYATLNVAKKMGVQMRGHVLTWHAQTDEAFYRENYKASGALVDKATMTARHEWYIKTVLGCVDAWEAANGYGTGNHIIWAWDVVNEAMADDAGKTYTGTDQNWLRGATSGTKNKSPSDYPQGSRWYQIYGNEEFIINAFRFANKYAPADVKLCYNDYNEYMDYSAGWKTSAIENIAKLIKANSEARLDVIAMQSHVSPTYPGVAGYENALKRFLAIADVHVSELDFAAPTQADATKAYTDYFKMLQKYGKDYSGAHKVTNVTIWGINNESSWINPASGDNKKTFPLLFNIVNNVDGKKKEVTYNTGKETLPQYDVGDTYEPNDAFWAVIKAHK